MQCPICQGERRSSQVGSRKPCFLEGNCERILGGQAHLTSGKCRLLIPLHKTARVCHGPVTRVSESLRRLPSHVKASAWSWTESLFFESRAHLRSCLFVCLFDRPSLHLLTYYIIEKTISAFRQATVLHSRIFGFL